MQRGLHQPGRDSAFRRNAGSGRSDCPEMTILSAVGPAQVAPVSRDRAATLLLKGDPPLRAGRETVGDGARTAGRVPLRPAGDWRWRRVAALGPSGRFGPRARLRRAGLQRRAANARQARERDSQRNAAWRRMREWNVTRVPRVGSLRLAAAGEGTSATPDRFECRASREKLVPRPR